jgi:glycosyltransferase involved in cell wall biosynthesis
VFRYLRKLSEKIRFDIINFPEYCGEGFTFALDRTKWNWVPTIVQLHGPLGMFTERIGWPDGKSELARVGTFMERVSIQHADWLMASSTNIADFSAQFYEVPRDRIDVVHCGVDPEMFRPAAKGAVSNAAPTVLFVGNLAANKGVGVVFEAVLRLLTRYPNIRLQLLGKGDDDLINSFRRRAEAVGAGRNIEFLGFLGDRAQLPKYYQQADVFCSPAHHEVGVANVYVEAMACGCPVVACVTGGAPEAVSHGKNGFLVRPGDVEATTAAIDKLLTEPSLRRAMGEAGRKRVEEYFSIDRYICRVLAAYEKAIQRSGRKFVCFSSNHV